MIQVKIIHVFFFRGSKQLSDLILLIKETDLTKVKVTEAASWSGDLVFYFQYAKTLVIPLCNYLPLRNRWRHSMPFCNVVLEKDGEDQLDRSCEK
jgi:hypothetical protein